MQASEQRSDSASADLGWAFDAAAEPKEQARDRRVQAHHLSSSSANSVNTLCHGTDGTCVRWRRPPHGQVAIHG